MGEISEITGEQKNPNPLSLSTLRTQLSSTQQWSLLGHQPSCTWHPNDHMQKYSPRAQSQLTKLDWALSPGEMTEYGRPPLLLSPDHSIPPLHMDHRPQHTWWCTQNRASWHSPLLLTAMAKDSSATAKDATVTAIEGAKTCHGKPTLYIYDLPGSLEDILDGYSTLSNSEALFISLLAWRWGDGQTIKIPSSAMISVRCSVCCFGCCCWCLSSLYVPFLDIYR